jgi:proline dehydrogenase
MHYPWRVCWHNLAQVLSHIAAGILMSENHLNFQDTATAFKDRTDAEIKVKYWLFRLMNSPSLTRFFSTSTEISLNLHLPIKGLIKKTIFKQFCGGETIEECEEAINILSKHNIGSILEYSVEGKSNEKVFDETTEEILQTIKRAKDDEGIPITVFKVTGVARSALLERKCVGQPLSSDEQAEWNRAKRRVETICNYAHSINKPVFIDGEESWIQDAIDGLAMEMMERFNRTKPLIFNTIQLYRHDRLEFLRTSHQRARENGYYLAVKLVRGAYIEKERKRAEKLRYPSPIHPNKEATDRAYNEALTYCAENLERIAFCLGSHNEESIQLLTRLMHERKVEADHPHVLFAQLYGMGDNLSYTLAKNGYNVSKYVPYGSVRDAIPYLIRRAKENTSMMGHMSREFNLIVKEMRRRGLS